MNGSAAHQKNIEAFSGASGKSPIDVHNILSTFRVGIQIPVALQPASDEFVQAYLLCNLLPRIFHCVGFVGTDVTSLPALPHLDQIARTKVTQADLTLVIGRSSSIPHGPALFVANRGWVAYLSRESQCDDPEAPPNAITAYFASALSIGEVFKTAFGNLLERCQICTSPFRYDLYNLREATGPVAEPDISSLQWDLGDLLVVGIGAVGQAFLDALSWVPDLRGFVELVDPDQSDEGNEQRCVFAFPNKRGAMKVNLAYETLKQRHPFLHVTRSQLISYRMQTLGAFDRATVVSNQTIQMFLKQDYGQFRDASGGKYAFPLVVCAVDSAQTRRDIQFGLHKVILNGWTRTAFGALEYGMGRHTVSEERACMACRYQPDPREPTFEGFIADRTGWDLEKVNEYLMDSNRTVSIEDVHEMSARRRIPVQALLGMVGKSLRAGLHEQCGVMQLAPSQQPAPVPHLGVLTGALLAAATIRELNGEGPALHLFVTDAQKVPNNYSVRVEPANPNCLCRDPDVRAVYDRHWPFERENIDDLRLGDCPAVNLFSLRRAAT